MTRFLAELLHSGFNIVRGCVYLVPCVTEANLRRLQVSFTEKKNALNKCMISEEYIINWVFPSLLFSIFIVLYSSPSVRNLSVFICFFIFFKMLNHYLLNQFCTWALFFIYLLLFFFPESCDQ